MISAKDLKDISDQHQCTEEEKNIIKRILSYCVMDAKTGDYQASFNAMLCRSTYSSLQDAILYFASPKIKIAYLKLKNQLISLGFHFNLCEVGNLLTNELDNSYRQAVIVTISWRG